MGFWSRQTLLVHPLIWNCWSWALSLGHFFLLLMRAALKGKAMFSASARNLPGSNSDKISFTEHMRVLPACCWVSALHAKNAIVSSPLEGISAAQPSSQLCACACGKAWLFHKELLFSLSSGSRTVIFLVCYLTVIIWEYPWCSFLISSFKIIQICHKPNRLEASEERSLLLSL